MDNANKEHITRLSDDELAKMALGSEKHSKEERRYAQAELERRLYGKPRTRPEPISWGSSALLIFVLMVAGGVLGWLIVSIASSPQLALWRPLGTPPQRATKILGAELNEVYVQTLDGTAYRFRDQWETTNWPRQLLGSQGCRFQSFPTSSPDDIDSIQIPSCGEVIAAAKYTIRSDGSVWRWGYYSSGMDQIGRALLYPPLFAAIGLVVGIVVVAILRNK
jgi:hypothetical protein